ncbi:MAG: hypothetical protein Q8909_12235, partial [Bacteroidota bacterium]|nr:hypothetical protein [Bacteroidota bacterium]
GRVLSLSKKKPKPNVEVLMFMTLPDSTSQRGTCMTDDEGKFNFALNEFRGKAKLTLQTKENGKRKENNIILDRMISPDFKSYSFQDKQNPENVVVHRDSISFNEDTIKTIVPEKAAFVDLKENAKLPMDKKTHRLKEVVVKGKKPFKREGESLRNANIVYDVEKTMDEMIDKGEDEPVALLDFLSRKNQYFNYQLDLAEVTPEAAAKLPGKSTFINDMLKCVRAQYKGKDVIFCINNISYATNDKRDHMINSEDIGLFYSNEIETLTIDETEGTSLVYHGVTGHEVVIFIYTYKDLHLRNSLLGIRQTKFSGYAYIKEFFQPNYEKALLPDEKDYRRTLYWNPDVKTDANGKANISFFNNGSCKAMNVSAETVTERGVIGVMCK